MALTTKTGRRDFGRKLVSCIALLSVLSIGTQGAAFAQEFHAAPPPLDYQLDANGVDLATGKFYFNRGPDVSIGPAGPGGLNYSIMSTVGHVDNWISAWNGDGVGIPIQIGHMSDYLDSNGVSVRGTGAFFDYTLPVGDPYRGSYTTRDGVRYKWGAWLMSDFYWRATVSRIEAIKYPTGEIVNINYRVASLCLAPTWPEDPPWNCRPISRIQSVTSNTGYMLHYDYVRDVLPDYWDEYSAVAEWQAIQKVTAINTTVEYCAPQADDCSVSSSWPSATYFFSGTTVDPSCILPAGCYRTITNAAGETWRYTFNNKQKLVGIRFPGQSTDSITITYQTGGLERVSTVTNAAGTTTYTYGSNTTTATNALGQATVATWDVSTGKVISIRDPLNRTTSFQYNSDLRLTRVTAPEGNYTQYTYDARGNITETRLVSKTAGTPADIVSTANFDTACSNRATCNQPNYTIDPKGNRTDFTYDSTGIPLSVTAPAPTTGAARPQVRNTVSALNARYLTAPGTYSNSTSIYRVTASSSCMTSGSCAGAAEERKSTLAYGVSGQPNNLLPTQVTTSAGNGTLASTVTSAYDSIGNITSVDGPLAGADDTTRTTYDVMRRPKASLGIDPDGGGPRKTLATRNTYDSRGFLTQVDTGTVNTPTDTSLSTFSVLETMATTYDSYGRQTKSTLAGSGSIYALRQVNYDSVGRPDCVVTRMNPSAFGAPPSDACALGSSGSFGADRIVRTAYTAAGQVYQVTSGYAGGNPLTESTTYSNNGVPLTVTDARGNVTTYEYDGFDRPVKTRYPHPTSTGSSSTTDYEQVLSYDANSNATSVRLRNGNSIGFTFDNLNRVTVKDLPGTSSGDVYFAYDNFDRMLWARFGSTGGSGIVYTYDAVGRATTTTSFGRAVTRDFQLANNRLHLTYPDGFYVDYNFNVAGQIASIVDSTSTTLASYAYDDMGRRTGFGRGSSPASSTGYAYDAVSRLASLTHDLNGSGYDGTTTFTYNPASQIATRAQVNDAKYTWSVPSNSTVNAAFNGLNQPTTHGGASISHDAYGNVSGDGTWTFAYDAENRLTSATGPNSTALGYDPFGLLQQVTPTSGTHTEFLYDGTNLIAEYAAGTSTVLRRYVHGAGVDEPIVWYEGAGYASRNYLFSDERGSVQAVADNGANGTANYTYSPDGVVSALTGVRFKYTGQIAIPEIGLYYYKARVYSASLGRFLQQDPIGYGDGMNLYAYVGNDPVNRIDPSGLTEDWKGPPRCVGGGCVTADDFFVYDPYEESRNEALEEAAKDQGTGRGAAFDFMVEWWPGASLGNCIYESLTYGGTGCGGGTWTLAAIAVLPQGKVAKIGKVAIKALPSPRSWLLRHATDPKLRNRIEALYRQTAKIGNGGTADALRHELRTGELLSPSGHAQKAIEMRNGLMDDLRSGRLSETDARIARDLLKDLQNALSGQ